MHIPLPLQRIYATAHIFLLHKHMFDLVSIQKSNSFMKELLAPA